MRVKFFENTLGKTFEEYSLYVMSKADLSVLLCSRGVITSSPDMMASSFLFRCNTSPKVIHSAVHMVIQFREYEDQHTGQEEKTEVVREFVSRMNWAECQYIAVMHRDVPGNAHCHLVINLIQDNGRKADTSYTIIRAKRAIKEMTNPQMRIDPEKEDRIRSMVNCAINESTTMRSLRDNLAMEMIEMNIDAEQNINFNEIGSHVPYTFPGLTALDIARRLHRINSERKETHLATLQKVRLPKTKTNPAHCSI